MRVTLLTALYGREENGSKRTLLPGVYDTNDESFPAMLIGESRPGIVTLDGEWETTPSPESDESGAENADTDVIEEENEKPKKKAGPLSRRTK